MLQRLDLTDAQKEQVKALTAERATQGAGRTLAGLERDLNAAVMADSPDTAKIEQLKTAIVEAQTAALNERVDLQLRIAQILTPEQRQKARDMPPGRAAAVSGSDRPSRVGRLGPGSAASAARPASSSVLEAV